MRRRLEPTGAAGFGKLKGAESFCPVRLAGADVDGKYAAVLELDNVPACELPAVSRNNIYKRPGDYVIILA